MHQTARPPPAVPEFKPARPPKSQAKMKRPPPPLPQSAETDLYEDMVESAQLVAPKVNPSPKPVPSKRTGKGLSSSPTKCVDHLYEDVGALSLLVTSPSSTTEQAKAESGMQSRATTSSGEEVKNSPSQPLKSKPLHHGVRESKTSDTSMEGNYIKFTKSSTSEESESLQQLRGIQTTLTAIVNQLGKLEERQSVFETELSQLKAATPTIDPETITVNSSMSPAEV